MSGSIRPSQCRDLKTMRRIWKDGVDQSITDLKASVLDLDLIQQTNLSQHNLMIGAINDIDARQVNIEGVTNVNIDDIADLKTDVIALSNEKLDKDDINADLHFGDITVSREGTAVIMSLDVLNPTTGITTPISFTIPGATSAEAGVMDASSVSWISEADERISALEGLSDVKAVADLSGAPTQAELTAGWVAVADKQPETGDILQDINNSKLWVFAGTDWVLYGTIVTVPLATTSTIGGVRDTSLTAPGNRWYAHVEADGRLALIGGNSLTTLIDTTIPAIQSATAGKVSKSGDRMTGRLYADEGISMERAGETGVINKRTDISYNSPWARYRWDRVADKDDKNVGNMVLWCSNADPNYGKISRFEITATNYKNDGTSVNGTLTINASASGDVFVTAPMRSSPSASDVVNKGYLDSRLATKQNTLTFDSTPVSGSIKPVTSGGVHDVLAGKQGTLTFDNAPTSGSNNPVKSGGIHSALAGKVDLPTWTYGSGTLTTNAGTCGYNYAYYVMGGVVTMRFTVGASDADLFTVPLPVTVSSASVQCMGISDNAAFWVDYDGITASTINVNRSQTTIQERSFHMLVIGQPLK